MDTTGDNKQKWEANKSRIVREVIHGCEVAKEVHNMLQLHAPLQLHQHHRLTDSSAQIVSSFTKVLDLLGCSPHGIPDTIPLVGNPIVITGDRHSFPAEFPHTNLHVSENPALHRHVDRSDATKRSIPNGRKGSPRWSVRVRGAETGSDGHPDDGYTWRKYGQKDIQGSLHPRSYYRCTHKADMGCEAQKQVQRAYDDPSWFDVTYIGVHSCRMDQSSTSHASEHALLSAVSAQEELQIEAAMTTMSLLTPPQTDAPMDFIHDHIPPATVFTQDKSFNFIDFLPPQPKESVDPVQYYGESGSNCMNVDPVESMVGETSSPKMPDLETMFHTIDVSEIQFGEKLSWNIKHP